MATVTSGALTVIVLDNVEASALSDLLYEMGHNESSLEELTNAMIGVDYE
jgi:hypothetical protein